MTPPNPFDSKDREAFLRARRKELKTAFSGRINGNFMLETCEKVIKTLIATGEISACFDWRPTEENAVTGDFDQVDYEVCRYVVGAHRSNMVFVGDADRAKAEASGEYQGKLFEQVLTNIRLRKSAGAFFRKKQIVLGDEFIFFNLPHDLFAISVNASFLLKDDSGDYGQFYASLFNKSLASLTLLEDSFLDCAYPICRSVIEVYLKLLVLKKRPIALKEYDAFLPFEVRKNLADMAWPKEFLGKFEKRRWKGRATKGDYLHFGWVDSIPDYFGSVAKSNPYSVYGLMEFLSSICGEKQGHLFKNLQTLYTFCNAYAHGNLLGCRYALNDYFQTVLILSSTIPTAYRMLCEDEKADTKINGIDIVAKTNLDTEEMAEQYKKRTTENFEAYYRPR
jgi:hypothetical protein